MADQSEFPESQRDAIEAALQATGAAGVVALIAQFGTIAERRALYGLARKVLLKQTPVSLDTIITVAQAAIADLIAESAQQADADAANALKDGANIFSYNLSADLAPCWPGDDVVRETRHYEVGLAAAQDCLKWRHELHKGPWPFSIAWWAVGVHQLGLGNNAAAIEGFLQSYHHAELVVAGSEADPNTDFGCLVAEGYLGLAEEAAGVVGGAERYAAAIAKFEAVAAGEPGEAVDDAKFGISQLQTMKFRL